ncbi:MAG TPA: hypothetical protein PKA06_01790, partial [Gemmatales bacterium]|nr:hypothetical protein [Gemmatales bacterium]
PNLPCHGPGRSQMGTFALTEFKVKVEQKPPADSNDTNARWVPVPFARALADYSNPTRDLEPTYDDKSNKKRVTGSIDFAIDGKIETAWGIDQGPGRRNQTRVALFIPEKPITLEEGANIEVFLTQQHGGWNSDDHMNNNLGRFRLSVTEAEGAKRVVVPPHILAIVQLPEEKRSPHQQAVLFSYWRTTVEAWKAENEAIEKLWQQWPAGTTSLTVQTREEPRETRILKRGEFLKPDRTVEPGVPAFLHPLPVKNQGNRWT